MPDHPWLPGVDQLIADHRPLPLVAQLHAVVGDLNWVTPIALGSPFQPCCSLTGTCGRVAGGWSQRPARAASS